MRDLVANIILAVVLLAVPVLAEFACWALGRKPGVGLDLLLYWPFEHAYAGAAFLSFTLLNAHLLAGRGRRVTFGVVLGGVVSFVWFAFAFLVVAQLHLRLGGTL